MSEEEIKEMRRDRRRGEGRRLVSPPALSRRSPAFLSLDYTLLLLKIHVHTPVYGAAACFLFTS